MFPHSIEDVGVMNSFEEQLYNNTIQGAGQSKGFTKQSTAEVFKIVYKAKTYTKGLVVMGENDDGYTFGKISLILVTESQVHLIVGVYQSVSLVELRVNFIPDSLINYSRSRKFT